jgi:hypothetical protein
MIPAFLHFVPRGGAGDLVACWDGRSARETA